MSGDNYLRAIARAIETNPVRSTDLAARYGGEEFICILPETGPPGEVKAVAERIRQAAIALNIPHPDSPTANHVTISLGVVTTRCLMSEAPDQLGPTRAKLL